MSVRIIHDSELDRACFYCSTSDWAFGPVAYGDDCVEALEAFLKYIPGDPRTLIDRELERLWNEFCRVREIQTKG